MPKSAAIKIHWKTLQVKDLKIFRFRKQIGKVFLQVETTVTRAQSSFFSLVFSLWNNTITENMVEMEHFETIKDFIHFYKEFWSDLYLLQKRSIVRYIDNG